MQNSEHAFKEVYVGLGSNLNAPVQQILNAFIAISQLENTTLIATSSLYQTKPWGILDQPDFINAVVKLHTQLSAKALLIKLLDIEKAQGRVRAQKNGPRTLDCDILLYGQELIHEKDLSVPHPGLTSRATVLVPLFEIAPTLIIPDAGKVQFFLAQCDCQGVTKLSKEEALAYE
ncbi:MAG: 2-amino-4-hydroxy-6-hydroxymethyldihydropteridine diphosphokinase [Proteobacteria bacterium]|nr:2-amino-4-hydroxy-6-hydroxymethyldihydropteridine diphosphokinase [Pseudomonadota bacterium]